MQLFIELNSEHIIKKELDSETMQRNFVVPGSSKMNFSILQTLENVKVEVEVTWANEPIQAQLGSQNYWVFNPGMTMIE